MALALFIWSLPASISFRFDGAVDRLAKAQRTREGDSGRYAEGLGYVMAHPRVFALIVLSILPFLFGMPLNTLLAARLTRMYCKAMRMTWAI